MEVDTIEKPRSVVYQNGATTVEKTRQDLLPRHEREKKRRQREAEKAYGRGKKINVRNIKDKKLRSNMKRLEHKYQDATMKAKDAEILLENTAGFLEPEAELERTYKVRQDEILSGVAVETATKRFELKLEDMGPYVFDYSRNGRDLLLGGRKGHIATMDWREGKLGCERQLGEIVRDVKWLHNNQYFAAAQKKYVYIYDHNGVELHCLKKHTEVTQMEFLPYHFLLATIVSPISIVPFRSFTNESGNWWCTPISRYLDRSTRRRTTNPPRPCRLNEPQPLQRGNARRPPERHRDSLVPQLLRTPRQTPRPPWPRPITSHGPHRSLHGIYRSRSKNGCLGYPHVQRSQQLFHTPTRLISSHLRYRSHSRRLGHKLHHLEGPIRSQRTSANQGTKPLHDMGRRRKEDGASTMVSL